MMLGLRVSNSQNIGNANAMDNRHPMTNKGLRTKQSEIQPKAGMMTNSIAAARSMPLRMTVRERPSYMVT
jgi:hypothetical protein